MPHIKEFTYNGEKWPSVNEVTGMLPAEGLDKWRKRIGQKAADKITNEAKSKGSNLAETMELYRLGKAVKEHTFNAVCVRNWENWYVTRGLEVLEVECHLVNTLDKYHGSPDVVLRDSRGDALLGDDKVKKRFADYRLLMNEHAYASCDSIEKIDGQIVPVPWQWPVKQIVFWTYDPDSGEMFPTEHKFDSRVYNDFLTLRNVWDINARAEQYFKSHATLLPSQKRANVTIAPLAAIPHAKGPVV